MILEIKKCVLKLELLDMINSIKEFSTKDKRIINQVFEEIYYEYGHLIGFVISQYVKNKQDVEELANDTFISLFNNITNLQESKNLKYYILVIN